MEPAANAMEPRSDNELNGSGIRLHGCGKTSVSTGCTRLLRRLQTACRRQCRHDGIQLLTQSHHRNLIVSCTGNLNKSCVWRGLRQGPSLVHRDDRIVGAVKDDDGRLHPGDSLDRRPAIEQQELKRKQRIVPGDGLRHGRECRIENHGGRLRWIAVIAGPQRQRHCPSKRFPKHDDSPFFVPEFVSGEVPDQKCVRREIRFRRGAGAVAETAVVEDEDIKSSRRDFAKITDSFLTVQRIAGKIENQRRLLDTPSLTPVAVKQPTSQRVAIRSLELNILAECVICIDVCNAQPVCDSRLVHQPSLTDRKDDNDDCVWNHSVEQKPATRPPPQESRSFQ